MALSISIFPVWGPNWFGEGSFDEMRGPINPTTGKRGPPRHAAVDIFAKGGVLITEPSRLDKLVYLPDKQAYDMYLVGNSGRGYWFRKQPQPTYAIGDRIPAGWLYGFKGTPILAPMSGVVAGGEDMPGYRESGGWSMYLRGDDGYLYYFAHMAAKPVRNPGERVKAGNLLGYVGQSGNARTTKPHLHFQVIKLTADGKHGSMLNPTDQLLALKRALSGYPWPPPFDAAIPTFEQPYMRRGLGAALGLLTLGAAAGYTGYLSYRERAQLAANVQYTYSAIRGRFRR